MRTDWAGFVERAAIMEFDGGLSRQAATLTAYKAYFPDSFQELLKTTGGENEVFDLVENAIQDGKAPDTLKKREGTAALEYMTGKGIALIGVNDYRATINRPKIEGDYHAAFTSDIETIKNLISGEGDKEGRAKGIKIQQFRFFPGQAGFLCLDIDRKNGKDGIAEFYTWAEQAGKPRHLLPRYLQDIPQNFPCYVSTPSGGFHLYFRYSGAAIPKMLLSRNTPAVEIIMHTGLVSPGSYRKDGPYILHGEFENAPPLSAFILAAIEPPKQKAATYEAQSLAKKEWGKPSWDKIIEWTEKDESGGIAGRNDKAFHLARKARDHGYTEAEALDAIIKDGVDGLPEKEIKAAVKSAFSRRKTA